MKFNDTLKTVVRTDIKNGLIPMLLGEPGIGKSSWVEDLAKDMDTKCFTLAVNQLADKADLTGARLIPVKLDNGETTYKQFFYPHAVIHDAIDYANNNPNETPILFMDELNRTTPDVTSEALSIPTLRSIGSIKLPDNLRVITAGNDKGNITSLDEASVSRFVLYKVAPDTETFIGLDDKLNKYVKETLDKNPELIFCKKSENISNYDDDGNEIVEDLSVDDFADFDEEMNQITTPRTIMGASKWLNTLSDFEIKNLLTEKHDDTTILEECIIAHVGETLFANKLLQTIIEDFQNKVITNVNVKPTMPIEYNSIKAIDTRSELEIKLDLLTDEKKADILLYALYEKENNEEFLGALSRSFDTLKGDRLKSLIEMINQKEINENNLTSLLKEDTNLSNFLEQMINALI